MKKKASDIPQGWTNDIRVFGLDLPWETVFEGPYIAETFGLENPQFVMITSQETGEPLVIFQSNECTYICNQIEGNVFEITKPKDLDSILSILRQGDAGMKALKMKKMRCIN